MNNVTNPITTALERLQLLIPWLNGVQLPRDDVIVRIMRFIAESDLCVPDRRSIDRASERSLASLRRSVVDMLVGVVPRSDERTRPPFEAGAWPLRSLRFQVVRVADAPPKISTLSAAERREHFGPGRYRMVVSGDLRDVLLYTVMRTLTEPGAVSLARCPAPASGDWTRRCDRWFIVTGRRVGRPAKYCSEGCRVRAFKQREGERS